MSGIKRSKVDILGDELEALSKKFRKAEIDRNQLQNQIESIRAQNRQKLQELKQKFTDRAKRYEKGLQNVQADVKKVALDFEQALKRQHEAFIDSQREVLTQTKSSIANLKEWTSKQIQEQKKEFQIFAKQQSRELSMVKNRLNDLVIRENERQQYASSFIDGLEEMIKQDEELLPHEQFAPGQLRKIKQRLAISRNNLDNLHSQAALATAQETMQAYFEWKETVLNAERIYEALYDKIDLGFSELLKEVRKNRNVEVTSGAEYLEVNYWTKGAFADLESEVQNAIKSLENRKEEMDQEQLEEVLEELEMLSEKKDQLIDEALKRITSSQLRAEMGDLVINSLNKQGFEFINRGYEAQDQRKTYMIKFRNTSGVEIVAVISPDEAANENTISINTFGDTYHNEEDRLKRFDEIKKSLSLAGINIGETETEAQGIEEFKNIEKILEEGNTEDALKKAGILNSQTRS